MARKPWPSENPGIKNAYRITKDFMVWKTMTLGVKSYKTFKYGIIVHKIRPKHFIWGWQQHGEFTLHRSKSTIVRR